MSGLITLDTKLEPLSGQYDLSAQLSPAMVKMIDHMIDILGHKKTSPERLAYITRLLLTMKDYP